MRFRVRCHNRENRQRHEFELDGDSLHDVQHRLRERGLVPESVTPLAPSTRPRRLGVGRAIANRWPKPGPGRERLKRVLAYGGMAAVVMLILATAVTPNKAILPQGWGGNRGALPSIYLRAPNRHVVICISSDLGLRR